MEPLSGPVKGGLLAVVLAFGVLSIPVVGLIGMTSPADEACTPSAQGTVRAAAPVSSSGEVELSEHSREVAMTALSTAEARGASEFVIVALLEAGLVESDMRNLANDGLFGIEDTRGTPSTPEEVAAAGESMSFPHFGTGSDHTSVGFLQQQWWWGPMEVRMDPAGATDLFLDVALEKEASVSGSPGDLAQAVQVSAPAAYNAREAEARALLTELRADGDYVDGGDGAVAGAAAVRASRVVSSDCPTEAAGEDGDEVRGDAPIAAGPLRELPQKDDLPWPHSPVGMVSPLAMYNRECVDFALWRMNAAVGVTEAPWAYHNSELALGNAYEWPEAWAEQGWESGSEPRVGAIAWYGPNVPPATSALGHVGVVAEIRDGGKTVVIEEYNGMAAPMDHRYGVREAPVGQASSYLYLPDSDSGASPEGS